MAYEADLSFDCSYDCNFDGAFEGRDRGYSFNFLPSIDHDQDLPDLNSVMPLDQECGMLQHNSYPSTEASTDPTHEDPFFLQTLHPWTSRSQARPSEQFNYVPQPVQTRQIGTLSPEERYNSIKRYRDKRERRIWSKKINYGCRKRVADNRLRIKGRFVTKQQAKTLSGGTSEL
jgi:hypothetical protein